MRALHGSLVSLCMLVLGCASKADPGQGSSPSSSVATAVVNASASPKSASSSAPPLDTPPDSGTTDDRRQAAMAWLKYYEKIFTKSGKADEAELARLSYPIDPAYARERLAAAEAELVKAFDPDAASDVVVELERQGQDDRAKALAARIAKTPLPEDPSPERAAVALVDALGGDTTKAMKRVFVPDESTTRASLRRYLENLASLGKVGALYASMDGIQALPPMTKLHALAHLARLPTLDKGQVNELAKRFDAALQEPETEMVMDDLGKAQLARSRASAEAALIDALARVGATDEAKKRIGDVLRFPSKSAPMILDATERQRLVARDKAKIGATDFDACSVARGLSAIDPEASRRVFVDAEKDATHCIDSFDTGPEHFAIADQKRLIAYWKSNDSAHHGKALDVLVSTILERTDIPLDRGALADVQAELTR